MAENFLDIWDKGTYVAYSSHTARRLKSVHAAILLCELSSLHDHLSRRDQLVKHEQKRWVTLTHIEMTDRLGLTRREQDAAIKLLKRCNLIEVSVFGMPPSRHFRFFSENKKAPVKGHNIIDNLHRPDSTTFGNFSQ